MLVLTMTAFTLLTTAPPMVQADPEPVDCDTVPLLAAVLLPGARLGESVSVAGSGYVEVRPFTWLGLRTGAELSRQGHSIDFLGVKLSPLATATFRPYLVGAISGDFPERRPGESFLGFAGSAGLDVSLGAGFFIEAEARMRLFKSFDPQWGAFAGLGFEFL